MADSTQQQVALLIDFENLVFGLKDVHGDDFPEELEPELLFKLAEEYGQVVLANAYADWRFRDVNQFQTELYRLGIDLIHVFGSKFKNAVDVKMAVDAIETVWTLPHVGTFIIVSGDRDFIHVLKTLRRYGKSVIGVSPAKSASDDFAALCDRFLRYGALSAAYGSETVAAPEVGAEVRGLDSVRQALKEITFRRADGIKGGQIKPLLRRKLSPTFDESEYGFSRLSELLVALSDTVKIVFNPTGGDITVYPAGGEEEVEESEPLPAVSLKDQLVARSGLRKYRYEVDSEKRRQHLQTYYKVLRDQEPFSLNGVFETMLDDHAELQLSISVLAKCQTMLWQARAFQVDPGQQDLPNRERLMRLDSSIRSTEDLIFRYESSVAYKLMEAGQDMREPIGEALLGEVLGLADSKENREYCTALIRYVKL
jgi:hypothetical protein